MQVADEAILVTRFPMHFLPEGDLTLTLVWEWVEFETIGYCRVKDDNGVDVTSAEIPYFPFEIAAFHFSDEPASEDVYEFFDRDSAWTGHLRLEILTDPKDFECETIEDRMRGRYADEDTRGWQESSHESARSTCRSCCSVM